MKSERALKILLRVVGSAALLATVAVFMPYSWMDAIHRMLGMGELPSEPIVGYLARSTSLFYAIVGGLAWVVSFDLRRHAAVTLYLGIAFVCAGVVLLGVDVVEGMPWFWSLVEAPTDIGIGAIILVLRRGAPAGRQGGEAGSAPSGGAPPA